MAFTWDRMYKHEEQLEQQVLSHVAEYVCEYYNVEDFQELNSSQIADIEDFISEFEYSIMAPGFRTLINWWEDEHPQEDDE